jgi:ABC-type oligopeptide transport system substrate-binding subunit
MKKWKKKRTWTLAMTLVLLAVLSLSACGSKLSNPAATAETTAAGYGCEGSSDNHGPCGRRPEWVKG